MKSNRIILALLTTLTTLAFITPAASAVIDPCAQAGDKSSSVCADFGKGSDTTVSNFWGNIISTMLMVIGLLAVAVIIYGGLMYVTSAGKSDHIAKSKNIIIYAVVALVVAISAYAIVTFVLSKL